MYYYNNFSLFIEENLRFLAEIFFSLFHMMKMSLNGDIQKMQMFFLFFQL